MKKKIQKPFDAEAAKGGAKVETKCGDSVRIICYDRKGPNFPIIALTNHDGIESCFSYTSEGKLLDNNLFDNYQGEHDLVIIEDVEVPKFNIGDWILSKDIGKCPWLVVGVTSDHYVLQDLIKDQKVIVYLIDVEKDYRLWTLKDAKPGDVLIREDGRYPIIYRRSLGSAVFVYCGLSITDSILIDDSRPWTNDPVRPATYKERQEFFKKMKEEGYKWNQESLTLSEIPRRRWADKEEIIIKGFFVNPLSKVVARSGYNTLTNYNIFVTKELAKSALAMARISQIMAKDSRFGGPITDKEWCNVHLKKFVIKKLTGRAVFDTTSLTCNFLAFHTADQRQLFWEENERLIKEYLMIKDNTTLAE